MYDISVGISPDLPVWPGDPPVKLERLKDVAKGDDSTVTHLSFGAHVGTHVDAPLHFLEGGDTVDHLPLRLLTGRAYVVDMGKAETIDEAALQRVNLPPRTRRVLFKTRNSELWGKENRFVETYVSLTPGGVNWLVKKGVQLVGVDYLSVAPFKDTVPTHRALLSAKVIILEGLDLREVSQGRYTLYCLPLKLVGAEGAPARAILVGV
jgi:arylformamidase